MLTAEQDMARSALLHSCLHGKLRAEVSNTCHFQSNTLKARMLFGILETQTSRQAAVLAWPDELLCRL